MSNPPAQPPEGNSAFVAAASVLGIVAIAQVVAVAWFVATHQPASDVPTAAAPAPAALRRETPNRQQLQSQQSGQAAPQISRTHAVANIPTIDPATMTPPPAAAHQGGEDVAEEIAVQNKAALFYLDKGMALRNEGDMQGALVHFNSAASLEQNHPRILYEFAVTYEAMGLSQKATNFWKTIYEMGPVRGGDYHALADFRLKGQTPKAGMINAANVVDSVVTAIGPEKKFLEVVSAIAEPDDTVAEGERVVLNVLIKSSPEFTVNPKYVHVRVDFYDLVNESMVDLTRAVPANRWVTQPVDWRDQAEELLEVSYFLPPQMDQDILDFGQRAYHGYVIKVFYRDELQDVIAEPSTLLDMAESRFDAQSAPPLSDESFLPR